VSNRIYIGPRPLQPGSQPGTAQPQRPQATAPSGTFQKVLEGAITQQQPIKFSGHAQERLAASRRSLSEKELTSLAQAVDRAAQKGARDALVLMPDLALVVSVKNRTVITAVDGERMKENIFTNIDSAVIL
jgi:flagellar operon protein